MTDAEAALERKREQQRERSARFKARHPERLRKTQCAAAKKYAARKKAVRVLPPCACGEPAEFFREGKCRACHYRDLTRHMRDQRDTIVYPPCACGKKAYALGRCFSCYERARRLWAKGLPANDELL